MRKKLQILLGYTLSALHIVLVTLMVVVGLISLFRPDLMRVGIEWMGVQIKSWGDWNYYILFFVAMAESFPFVGAVLPGMNIIILVGGFFVARQWDVFPVAAAIAMTGACLGNALGYFMGKYGNPDTLKKYGAYFGAGPVQLAWLERQIHKNGFWFIVGGKFHSLLRSFIPYIAGSHQMKGMRFWFANIVGSSIWAVAILLLGVFAVENYEIVLQYLNYIFLGAIFVGVLIYYLRSSKKKDL